MAIKLTGAQDLYDSFRFTAQNMADMLQDDIAKAVEDGVTATQNQLYPGHGYKSGYMHDHIHSIRNGKWGFGFKSEATYTSYVDQGPVREYHFMKVGSDVATQEIVDAITTDMKKLLKTR